MNRKLSYCTLFIFFSGVYFSLQLNAQQQPALDTIVITPQVDYSIVADSTITIDEETIDDDKETSYLNDTLVSHFRPIPFDSIQKINNDKRFYYKTYLDSLMRASNKAKEKKPAEDTFLTKLFKLLIWVGAISIFAFLVYKLFLSNSSLFSRNRSNTTGEKINAGIENPEDPASLVDDAVREGNYRLAVRYLFLQTLKNLADKKYIKTGTEKTNYQYVNELRGHPLANEFASLTLKYEYVWYGEYPLDAELYEQIFSGFKNFNKNINR